MDQWWIDKKLLKKAQLQADKEIKDIFLQQMKEKILSSKLNGNLNLNAGGGIGN